MKRPHRAINRHTPSFAYTLIPKAQPLQPDDPGLWRIRYGKVDNHGRASLRWNNKMLHLGIGRNHCRKDIIIIMQKNIEITVIQTDGEVIAEFTLNTKKNYQPNKIKNG